MSDKPISVGDLVMMVRGHECVLARAGGRPFVVTALVHPWGGGWHCGICHKDSAGPNEIGAAGLGRGDGIPISWLKRIPPLDELESEKRDEEITA